MEPVVTDIQDSSPFEALGPIIADKDAELLWRQGKLQRQWVEKYPELFDARDLDIFLNQPQYHYFEACGAIWWLEQGYFCLVEKYDIKTPKDRHPRKAQIFHQLITPSLFERWWAAKAACHRTGPPDLFVYRPDLSEWFLCEVKGPTDSVRRSQRSFWLELENILGKRVRVLNIRWGQEAERNQTQKAQQGVAPYVAQSAPSGER